MAAQAKFDLLEEDRAPVLVLSGDWTVDTIADLEPQLAAVAPRLRPGAVVDVAKLERFDVAGAYLIARTLRESPVGDADRIPLRGRHENAQRLLQTARRAYAGKISEPAGPVGLSGFLEQVG